MSKRSAPYVKRLLNESDHEDLRYDESWSIGYRRRLSLRTLECLLTDGNEILEGSVVKKGGCAKYRSEHRTGFFLKKGVTSLKIRRDSFDIETEAWYTVTHGNVAPLVIIHEVKRLVQ